MVIQNSLLIREFRKNFYVSNKALKKAQKKSPVYLKLPWIGKNSLKFERKIKLPINNCFGAVQPRVVFSTRRILPAIRKDVLPTFQQSNVVLYMNTCATAIVGTWVKRLNVCRTESASMLPKSIRNRTSQERKQPERPGKLANSIPHCNSAIENHLLHNQKCASHYKDNQFFILSKARFDFHLSVLKSIFITLRKPNLSRQKEFVYKHKLLV